MNLFILGIFALGACFGVLLMAIFVAGCRDEQIHDDIEWFENLREQMGHKKIIKDIERIEQLKEHMK